jgi:hypothetical protein
MLKPLRTIAFIAFVLVVMLGAALRAQAQDVKTPYPNMAPVGQYLMERDAEIALARSAAPVSISMDAEIMVLGNHGYENAVNGKNGFVCMVERSWSAPINDPDFWNPKLRGPICLNAPAGRSKAQMSEAMSAAFDKKELPTIESGAMCYMLSKQGYLSDSAGHWHPHLMFFVPLTDPAAWGADSTGSPIIAAKVDQDRLTIFLVPVGQWSDGTADTPMVESQAEKTPAAQN